MNYIHAMNQNNIELNNINQAILAQLESANSIQLMTAIFKGKTYFDDNLNNYIDKEINKINRIKIIDDFNNKRITKMKELVRFVALKLDNNNPTRALFFLLNP